MSTAPSRPSSAPPSLAPDGVVSTQTMELLRICQEAIDETKFFLPYGAGNQMGDFERTGGASAIRTAAQELIRPDLGGPKRRLGPMRASSLLTGAGNCQEQAAVVHGLLRQKLSGDHIVAFVTSRSYMHHFMVAWHKDRPAIRVAADSWPIRAQAVLLADHFTADRPLQVECKKPCGTLKAKLDNSISKLGRSPSSGGAKYARLAGLFPIDPYPTIDKLNLEDCMPSCMFNRVWNAKAKRVLIYTEELSPSFARR